MCLAPEMITYVLEDDESCLYERLDLRMLPPEGEVNN